MAAPREKVKHRTGGQRSSSKRWKQQSSSKRWKQIVTIAEIRFSAKEGASRSDQARPKTNMQVFLLTLILSGIEAEKWMIATNAIRHSTGGLVMGKVRRTGSTAPKRGSDPTRLGRRPT